MNDLEMAKELVDMGYDVEYDYEKENYNKSLVAEMAVNEGYEWDKSKEQWRK